MLSRRMNELLSPGGGLGFPNDATVRILLKIRKYTFFHHIKHKEIVNCKIRQGAKMIKVVRTGQVIPNSLSQPLHQSQFNFMISFLPQKEKRKCHEKKFMNNSFPK